MATTRSQWRRAAASFAVLNISRSSAILRSVPSTAATCSPPLALFSPFGPTIAKAEMPPALVEQINRFADRHVCAREGSEFLLPPEVIGDGGEASLSRQTQRLIARYVRRMEGVATPRIQLDKFWIVSRYAGTPSPVHFHTGDISGVLHLKVPQIEREEHEEKKTYISSRQAGYINFLGLSSASSRAWLIFTCFPDGSCMGPSPFAERASGAPWRSMPSWMSRRAERSPDERSTGSASAHHVDINNLRSRRRWAPPKPRIAFIVFIRTGGAGLLLPHLRRRPTVTPRPPTPEAARGAPPMSEGEGAPRPRRGLPAAFGLAGYVRYRTDNRV
ncbi:MAG TPA: hypothetical protein VGI22_00850 [Xanthobacteraceae bacterium]